MSDELKLEKLKADVRKSRADARKAEVEARAAVLKEEQILARAENNFIYHFLGAVNSDNVHKCIHTLDNWSRMSADQPFTINIYSPGGGVLAGLALFDYLQEMQDNGREIYTVARGQAASMAAVILQAGSQRIVSASSYMLIHEISSTTIGKYSEMETDLEFNKRLQNKILKILGQKSTMTVPEIREKWRYTDWWLDAHQAVRLGFADRIL